MRLSVDRGMDFGGGRWLTAPACGSRIPARRLGRRAANGRGVGDLRRGPEPGDRAAGGRRAGAGRPRRRHGGSRQRSIVAIGSARASMIDESLPVGIAGAIVELLAGDADAAGRRLRPAVEAWAGSDSRQLRAELGARRGLDGDRRWPSTRAVAATRATTWPRSPGRSSTSCREPGGRPGRHRSPAGPRRGAGSSRRDGDDDPATWARRGPRAGADRLPAARGDGPPGRGRGQVAPR